ncbi:MAG: hypothetical protein FWF70_03570 [Bacteroidetes bacterium]|nr:hypothetical protein [Bacteroidota bacterium]MCL1968453.1 hypothetical protein [Bacteroidota bacterium]
MKKKLFFLLCVLSFILSGISQTKNEVTILYLLPFHLNEGFISTSSLKNSTEIHQVKQFEMMGFWLGAKMALKEYESTDKKVRVIVRDAVKDKPALNRILNDALLMKDVDIIIGPFYGSLFPVAAEYAKNHCITIVNPFSTRYDFVENNPYMYKLVPPFVSRPEIITTHFLSQPEQYNVILWGDSAVNIELQAYKYFFNEHHIRFKEIHTLNIPEDIRKTNLIIALFDKPERVIHGVNTLINQEEERSRIVVVPEKWLSISELTEDFYNLPDLYYFTNYFVEQNSDRVKQFQTDYTFYYEAPADLADYSYQGYDITRYFIDLYFAGFAPAEVQFKPLSYHFKWQQILNGGFENVKTRFIQVKNLEFEEVE